MAVIRTYTSAKVFHWKLSLYIVIILIHFNFYIYVSALEVKCDGSSLIAQWLIYFFHFLSFLDGRLTCIFSEL